MNASQHKGKTVLLDGVSKHHDLGDTSRKGRIVFEVLIKGEDSRLKLLVDVLESERWKCEGGRLTLTVPKDAFSSGNRGTIRSVHNAITKMKYLLSVARIDYDMKIISEASTRKREGEENVVKLKIGLVGDSRVGKTSLIRRFVLDQFDDKYIRTIGAKVSKKEILLPLSKNRRMRVDMMIWDVMGKKITAELYVQSQFKGMQGILAVCDVTRNESLSSVDDWTSSVFHVAGNVPVHILVNKMDLEDQFEIEESDVVERSKSLGSPFTFTSAKTGENVERVFFELAQTILYGKEGKEVAITAR